MLKIQYSCYVGLAEKIQTASYARPQDEDVLFISSLRRRSKVCNELTTHSYTFNFIIQG
jgi:hypothetical protein